MRPPVRPLSPAKPARCIYSGETSAITPHSRGHITPAIRQEVCHASHGTTRRTPTGAEDPWDKTAQDDRRAKERADIAARIARFKSTQEKFAQEREDYASQAWRKAHRGEAAE